jgi:hypothetical protein
MKTTLIIDDSIMAHVREEAARQGCTISEMVDEALRLMLDRHPETEPLPLLPSFASGAQVDIADRDALHEVMEGR